MGKTLLTIVIYFTVIFFCAGAEEAVIGQTSGDEGVRVCQATPAKGLHVNIMSVKKATSRKPFVIDVHVVLDDGTFETESMTKVAKYIRDRYCEETNISIVFFDNESDAKEPELVSDYLLGKRPFYGIRGFYSFERSSNKGELSYSSKHGSSPYETKLTTP